MPPSTSNSSKQFDFITQSGPTPQNGFKLGGHGLPKFVIWGIIGVFVIAVIVIAYSLFTSGKSGQLQNYEAALARGQEIIRVSGNVNQVAKDPPTQNLSATVSTSLTSQQAQIVGYLTAQKIKIPPLQLAVDKDATTDTEMNTAATNGNLNTVYASYLKTALAQYQNELHTAYKNASPRGKAILSAGYNSTTIILQSPQLASSN